MAAALRQARRNIGHEIDDYIVYFMKTYQPSEIRNFAIVGHASAGKTMLAEAMLVCGGVLNRFQQAVPNALATMIFRNTYHAKRGTLRISSEGQSASDRFSLDSCDQHQRLVVRKMLRQFAEAMINSREPRRQLRADKVEELAQFVERLNRPYQGLSQITWG